MSNPLVRTSSALGALALLLLSGVGQGQTISGTILGTVTDPSGNVIVGAQVTVTREGTGNSRAAVTGPAGDFAFPSLQAGAYTVRVEAPGFQRFERRGTVISANDRLSVGNLQLSIGSVNETVSVSAQGSAVPNP